MAGEIKIVVTHKLIGSGSGSGSGNNGQRKAQDKKQIPIWDKNVPSIDGIVRSGLENIGANATVVFGALYLANLIKQNMVDYINNYANLYGDITVAQPYEALKGVVDMIKNPLGIVGTIYKYNQEIAKINATSNLLSIRSGNDSYTNGGRGTNN